MNLSMPLFAPFTRFIVIGPGSFGYGKTIGEARQHAQKAYGAKKMPMWLVYAASETTEVDGGGGFATSPNDDGTYTQPHLVAKVRGNDVEMLPEGETR
jgi:hypothetical protein